MNDVDGDDDVNESANDDDGGDGGVNENAIDDDDDDDHVRHDLDRAVLMMTYQSCCPWVEFD